MAKTTRFAQLHNHSEYSLLDGMLHLEDMFKSAKEFGQSGVGVMDHGTLGGIAEAAKLSQKYDLPLVPGLEAYFVPDFSKTERGDRNVGGAGKARYHLSLLATSNEGFKELSRLSSSSFSEDRYFSRKHPLIDLPAIDKFLKSGDVKIATGCIGSYANQLYLAGKEEEAIAHIKDLESIVGKENLYIEVMGHNFPDQLRVKRWHSTLGKRLDLPYLGTNDSHYLKEEDAHTHQAFLCAGTASTLEDPALSFSSDENWFADTSVMESYFPLDDFPGALSNAADIAESSTFSLDFSGDTHLIPHFPFPDQYASERDMLADLTNKGLRQRYSGAALREAQERLDYELSVIDDMGFNGYFLITWDFVSWGKARGIRFGPGRGSAAGSIVAYTLGIPDIEPISSRLTFERFLNPSRVSMPDIDIDIDPERREEIVEYIAEKYGREAVSRIATYGTLKARSAIQSGGRVNGVSASEYTDLSKMMPDGIITVEEALSQSQPTREQAGDERIARNEWRQAEALREEYLSGPPRVKDALDTAKGIEGYRSIRGVHAGGVVITPGPSTDFFPLGFAKGEILACEYDKYAIEDLGALKMDLLGLSNLTVISEALKRIQEDLGEDINIDTIPLDDPDVFQMIADGETTAVFQMESYGMTQLAMDIGIENIDEVSACIALYRPGPLGSNFHKQFAEAKFSGQLVENVIHEDMRDLLKDTYGVVVFQEQLIELAMHYAGYSAAEGDTFRKAIGKKDRAILDQQESSFKSRMKEHGYGKVANPMWDMIIKFAEYAFNRAHTAAYAKLAYQTAWLKYYYPAQYGAGCIVGLKEDSILDYFKYLQDVGVTVLPPDINKSDTRARTIPSPDGDRSNDSLILGLGAVAGCGEEFCNGIVEVRRDGGDFEDLFDFTERVVAGGVRINISNFSNLITAGALDNYSFGASREAVRLLSDDILNSSRDASKEVGGGVDLFSFEDIPELDPWRETARQLRESKARLSDIQDMSLQRGVIGFFVGAHPMESLLRYKRQVISRYPEVKTAYSVTDALNLNRGYRFQDISVFGIVVEADRKYNTSNRKPAFASIEDEQGNTLKIAAFGEDRQYLVNDLSVGDTVVISGSLQADSFTGENRLTYGDRTTVTHIDTSQYSSGVETVHVSLDRGYISNDDLRDRLTFARSYLEERADREEAHNGEKLRVFHIDPPSGRGGFLLDQSKTPLSVYLSDEETREVVNGVEKGEF